MKQRIAIFLLALTLLLSACAPTSNPDPAPDPEPVQSAAEPEDTEPATEPEEPAPTEGLTQRERDWIEDIEHLRTEYKERHMDPFYLCPEEEFDWKLDRLKAKVGELSDTDLFFEINAVIAGMGDIHTVVHRPDDLYERSFPAWAQYFDGKLYLTDYKEGYEELAPYLLREIVSVNGVDMSYITRKADTTLNTFNTWSNLERFLFIPAFFDWVGCDYKEGYTLQILNDNQEVESVELPVISYEELSELEWVCPETWDEHFYMNGGIWTRYVEGENNGAVCLAMDIIPVRSPDIMQQCAEEVDKLFEEHPECEKLILDLRRCPGGDATMLSVFHEKRDLLDAEQVYVLTSGVTASGGTATMSFFKQEFGAVFVGEPTAQFPSFFYLNDSNRLSPATLPHSGIEIAISEKWHDGRLRYKKSPYGPTQYMAEEPIVEEFYDEDGKLYPWESTILPDVYVHPNIEDIRQGKDTVIEWVLAQ